MAVAAGVLAIVFACLHGLNTLPAEPQEGWKAAPPKWARVAWQVAALIAFAGGVYLIADRSVAGAVLTAVGLIGTAALAVANGYWIHGRPTLSHHVVRVAIVLVILGLAFAGAT